MEGTQEQLKEQETSHLKPWQFKPGQSGNPGGRPKGRKSLKTFAREYLESLSDEEKLEFLKGMDKIDIFKMAEGNPETKQETTVIMPEPIAPTKPLNNEILTNNSVQEDIKPTEENQNSTGGNLSIEDSLKLNLLDSQSTDGQNTNSN